MKILIIGGSGGIGTALVSLFVTSKPEAIIYATYRTHRPLIENNRVRWYQLDATSEQDVRALANSITSLDILINAAGSLHLPSRKPEKSVNEFNPDFFNHNIQSNVVPTMYLAKYFAKHLKSKQGTYFIAISARIGSIEDNKIGGWISYRCSKAALNMAIKTISIEWKHKLPNCCVFAFHPGTTDTNLSKPFQRNVPSNKLFTSDYVAYCLLELLDAAEPTDSGKFFSYDGTEIPW
ncbi:SDR family NAD(P)-dependent oxidoreductase [Photobacterium alginatilyticum]|uniref:SDR family NAD(P)-dependent oxidoreductase n=1 Tax=Photobacterium alginatilyticum TaxID=1775171 RepID=A0ABW9YP35_9GAMM|nr:SDR family NAD(P)-dependent oxidoreductase [Photobacterium alginatilyticum]NBI55599.1 SDR family NAD(P)-dependent oxidoreductase [Photobacterium alginatilyticum]